MDSSSRDEFKLVFSKDNMKNTSLNCEALAIRYEVSTPLLSLGSNSVTRIRRLTNTDSSSRASSKDTSSIVAEWKHSYANQDSFRFPAHGQYNSSTFMPTSAFSPCTWTDGTGLNL